VFASVKHGEADFGINYGQQYGFKQDVALRIQVEAIASENVDSPISSTTVIFVPTGE